MKPTARGLEVLDGTHTEAARFAMSAVVHMTQAIGTGEHPSIEKAHIDACALMSPARFDVLNDLADHGRRLPVPATLSVMSLDRKCGRLLPEAAATLHQDAVAFNPGRVRRGGGSGADQRDLEGRDPESGQHPHPAAASTPVAPSGATTVRSWTRRCARSRLDT